MWIFGAGFVLMRAIVALVLRIHVVTPCTHVVNDSVNDNGSLNIPDQTIHVVNATRCPWLKCH